MSTIITKENPNGMNEIVIDMTPRQEPHDPHRGFGREVLRNVHYRIDVPLYTYTFGYSDKYEKVRQQGRENARRYFDEVVAILQAAGWTLVDEAWRKEHTGDCPQLTKGDQKLYCHPQDISGCVKPDEVDAVGRLFAGAKTFRHYKTDDYRDVIVTTSTDDEMQLYHQTHDATVNQALQELTTTKRRNLYKNEGAVWHILMNLITTAMYLLRANVSNSDFYFEYADCGDVWTALEQFWHDDYPEVLPEHDGSPFPITVTALDGNGEACGQHTLTFNSAAFHAFYDHGHKASGPYTLDEFALDVCHHSGPVANPVQEAKDIIALWSDWCMDYDDENLWLDYMVRHPKGHCNRQHLQQKWDYCYEKYGNKAAMNMFWRELDSDNRTILTEYVTTQWHKD